MTSSGIQFFASTKTAKIMRLTCFGADGLLETMQLNFKCFNSSGTPLSSESDFPNEDFTYVTSTTFGNSFKRGTVSNEIDFMVGDEVEYIAVIISGNGKKLTGFSLKAATDGSRGTDSKQNIKYWTSFDNSYGNIEKGLRRVAATPPTSSPDHGNFSMGEIIYANDPDSLGFIGWVCTDPVTPLFKTFGAVTT